jgi:hypothetical protein
LRGADTRPTGRADGSVVVRQAAQHLADRLCREAARLQKAGLPDDD